MAPIDLRHGFAVELAHEARLSSKSSRVEARRQAGSPPSSTTTTVGEAISKWPSHEADAQTRLVQRLDIVENKWKFYSINKILTIKKTRMLLLKKR